MSLKFIQKMSTLWEKFIQNRPVYKKLCAEHERATVDLDKVRHNFNALRAEHDKLLVEQDALSKKYERATVDLDKVQGNLNTLQAEHERTVTDLAEARHNFNKLSEEHNQTQAALAEARAEHERATVDLDKVRHNFNALRAEHDKLLVEQDALSKKYERATVDLDKVQGNLNTLQAEHERTVTALAEAHHNLNKLSEEHNQTQAALAEARAEQERTTAAFNNLSEEHDTLSQKYKLVSDLLYAKPGENEKFEKFKKLFKKDFMDFANKESSLAEEASAVQRLQRLEKHLEDIVAFPHTFTKKSIAIGGGYSSGKSAFVNSFITQPDIKLPVGIRPVTAIPSFVISSSEVSIKGFSSNGATVDIEPEFYRQLSHDFIKTLSFTLKDIMPYMAVEVPLKEGLFENIYLIDTPGYNPGGEITTEDRRTAIDFLKDRDALIWMIDVTAGTIPKSDLEFIRDIEPSVQFYVVLNKAELRLTELKDILEKVKETLYDEGIVPIGISAYSATLRKEYLSDGMSLDDFFLSQNQSVGNIEEELKGQIENVFAMYEEAIDTDEKEANRLEKKLKTLALDLLEFGKFSDKIEGQIEDIQKSQKRDFTPITEEMKKIKTNMIEAIDEIFWLLRSQSVEAGSQTQSTQSKARTRDQR